ncbi:MAG: ribonuclease III [Planctomycetota bacterium]
MESRKNYDDQQLVDLKNCERQLEYTFRDRNLLFEAVTHASSSNTRLSSYERLEFLGDSILGFVVCEYLYQQHPNWLEGQLTKIKSIVVSRQTCARLGADLGLSEFLLVGKGIGNRGPVPTSLLANAFESIVAAIYLDGGMQEAKTFLMRFVPDQVRLALEGDIDSNYKSELQQFSQKKFGMPPTYQLIDDRGPDHEKWFQVTARLGKDQFSPAWGKNKKEAEQKAAANALAEIHGNPPPFQEN